MNPIEVLSTVCNTLNNLNIRYMIVGADAVNFYGRPRTTHDIDLKVAILPKDVEHTFTSFTKHFYIDKSMIHNAIKNKSMFNIIHNETGIKVDFWLLKDDEYEFERFTRRRNVSILNTPVSITTAEDLIITKLDWYKESGSDKHYLDALGVYEIQYGKLDENYIEEWTIRKSTKEIWLRIKNEAII